MVLKKLSMPKMNVCSVVTYIVVVVIVILLLVLLFKGNKTENFQVSTAPTGPPMSPQT